MNDIERGGEMDALTRSLDWSQTALGPVETWPQSLRTATGLCLASRFPIVIYWGAELVTIYNDGYAPILRTKHPWALGRPCREVWAEIWNVIGPMLADVMTSGRATWSEDTLLVLERGGYPEECYFSFSFTPVEAEHGSVGGVFTAVIETTERVIGARRLLTLRELGQQVTEVGTVEAACERVAQTLASNPADLPFSLIYLSDAEQRPLRLIASSGVATTASARLLPPDGDDDGWSGALSRVLAGGRAERVDVRPGFNDLLEIDPVNLPAAAMVVPIGRSRYGLPLGVLVAGINPRRDLDEHYRGFYDILADSVTTAVANARAFEDERVRAAALAEIDRAKTAFFSNVSHEFRTPLTLMLGPTEDLLSGIHGPMIPEQRVQVELLRRNQLRLQRLVNALLDFSKVEAGRMNGSYEPVDLAALTRDLASSFRAAIERAGLTFAVDCAPLDEPVFVDPDMWEEIVLNLLSNALKFTFEGRIAVSLRSEGGEVVLRVDDTGVGIRTDEVPRLFERFHRVEGTRARTHEGSGIGLALVQGLVRLHGGTIRADSTYGSGTSFTVVIPKGSAHLPEGQVGVREPSPSTRAAATSFVEEALRWLPSDSSARPEDRDQRMRAGSRILIVDDNADMRDYLSRILEARWQVETAADGEAALAVARARPPDLILTDVMMPGLDGFGLLRGLRAEPATAAIPVIVLSARAGEESRVEGLRAGAADYLIKPFSARELVARVATHLERLTPTLKAGLEIEDVREDLTDESEQRYNRLLNQIDAGVAETDLTGRFVLANHRYRDIVGRSEAELHQLRLADITHVDDLADALQGFQQVVDRGTPSVVETRYVKPDGSVVWAQNSLSRIHDADGRPQGVAAVMVDITRRKYAEHALRESEQRFRAIFETAEVSIWDEDFSAVRSLVDVLTAEHGDGLRGYLERHPEVVDEAAGRVRLRDVNAATVRMFGASHKDELLRSLSAIFVPATRAVFLEELMALAEGRPLFSSEVELRTLAGERIDVLLTMNFGARADAAERVLVTLVDISARKVAEVEREARVAEMERTVYFSEMFVGILGHDLRNPLSSITTAANLLEMRADSERIAKPVGRIVHSADRMERMIAQLLDFTMIRLGRGLPLERTPVDLSEVARAIIDELGPVYKREIRLDAAGDLAGSWDRDRLYQLLSNLIGNACQHGTPGTPVLVDLDGSRANVVRLSVRNQGAVPPDLLPVLFDSPGSSESRKMRERSSTLGLGLYVTEQIATAHGGTIRVASTEQEGTSFEVEIARDAVRDPEDVFGAAWALPGPRK